jgi:histidine ammonia-lyase
MSNELRIDNQTVSLATLREAWAGPVDVRLGARARDAVTACRSCVDDILAAGLHVYGINTGFGLLADVSIEREELIALQENLVLSHSAGVGAPLDDDIVRLILVLKVMSLARGYSGISV